MGAAWSCGLSGHDWSLMTCTRSAEPDAENCALVFIKPRAFTPAMVALVSERLSRGGLRVVESGTISADEIQRRGLVDKHYASISTKATRLHPRDLQVPGDLFAARFGVQWSDVLRSGSVVSAAGACERFGWSEEQLSARWDLSLWRDQVAHLGAGLYIGRLDLEAGEIYVVNGFYPRMRRNFISEGGALQYYVVHFDASQLPWSLFRAEILGTTDPARAPVDSLRGTIFAHWRELGMTQEPSVDGNAVHASASPLAALAERLTWLGRAPHQDGYGAYLLRCGLNYKTLLAWCKNPHVGGVPIFDLFQDMDSLPMAAAAMELEARQLVLQGGESV